MRHTALLAEIALALWLLAAFGYELYDAVKFVATIGPTNVLRGVLIAGVALGLPILYLLPWLIARYHMHHRKATAILILNLLAGWTLIGWIGALLWALYRPEPRWRVEPPSKPSLN